MVVIASTDDIEVRVSPKRIFKAVAIEGQNMLPKMAPNAIKSIDVLHGDGGAGTIRQINFPDGAPYTHVKQKIDAVDTQNLVDKYHMFEGPMFGDKLEAIHLVVKYEDSGDGECIIKYTTELHTKGDAPLTEEDHKAAKLFDLGIFNIIEEYLIANPTECA